MNSGSSSSQNQEHSQSRSYTYQLAPLLRPEKLMVLPGAKTLIMRSGTFPVKTGQYTLKIDRFIKSIEPSFQANE